ncbi:MAG: hypothetical protein AAF919_16205 [Pseudomonadota bacterium]
MTDPHSLSDLRAWLAGADPNAPLIFAAGAMRTQGDWHVARMSLGAMAHVDCDGSRSAGSEAVLELFDLPHGQPMSAAKFDAIADRSAKALPGLAEAPLQVAFAGGRHTLSHLERAGGSAIVHLAPEAVACRPLARSGCCA